MLASSLARLDCSGVIMLPSFSPFTPVHSATIVRKGHCSSPMTGKLRWFCATNVQTLLGAMTGTPCHSRALFVPGAAERRLKISSIYSTSADQQPKPSCQHISGPPSLRRAGFAFTTYGRERKSWNVAHKKPLVTWPAMSLSIPKPTRLAGFLLSLRTPEKVARGFGRRGAHGGGAGGRGGSRGHHAERGRGRRGGRAAGKRVKVRWRRWRALIPEGVVLWGCRLLHWRLFWCLHKTPAIRAVSQDHAPLINDVCAQCNAARKCSSGLLQACTIKREI